MDKSFRFGNDTIQENTPAPQSALVASQNQESITALLNSLFPEQRREEKDLRQVKALLGDLTSTLAIDEIHTLISEIQYLVSAWLDHYEKDIFKGKTLKEILNDE